MQFHLNKDDVVSGIYKPAEDGHLGRGKRFLAQALTSVRYGKRAIETGVYRRIRES